MKIWTVLSDIVLVFIALPSLGLLYLLDEVSIRIQRDQIFLWPLEITLSSFKQLAFRPRIEFDSKLFQALWLLFLEMRLMLTFKLSEILACSHPAKNLFQMLTLNCWKWQHSESTQIFHGRRLMWNFKDSLQGARWVRFLLTSGVWSILYQRIEVKAELWYSSFALRAN